MSRTTAVDPTATESRSLTAIKANFGHGPFTTAQAETIGVFHPQLKRLVHRGLVTSIFFGVYRIGQDPLDLSGRARAAGLVLPPGGALARRTVAWLLGVDARSPDERTVAMDVECVVPKPLAAIRRPGMRCFQAELDSFDLTEIEGIACTTPTRTAADLLRWLDPPMGLASVDALAAADLILPSAVIATLDRWPGHRFIDQARRLASWIEPLTESFGESWLRLRILDAGFPRPTAQIPIQDDTGRLVYRLDLGWPEYKIGIEYDGREFHSTRDQLHADQQRRDRLAAKFGWQVVGVGLGEVFGRDMRLELGIGELIGMQPTIRRRTW